MGLLARPKRVTDWIYAVTFFLPRRGRNMSAQGRGHANFVSMAVALGTGIVGLVALKGRNIGSCAAPSGLTDDAPFTQGVALRLSPRRCALGWHMAAPIGAEEQTQSTYLVNMTYSISTEPSGAVQLRIGREITVRCTLAPQGRDVPVKVKWRRA